MTAPAARNDSDSDQASAAATTAAVVPIRGGKDPEVLEAKDGRHARGERSRRAMVDALLDLVQEGNLRPSSAEIAERAGVTQRTLFNQFGDMETLIEAVGLRQMHRLAKLLPVAGTGPFEQRVSNYCDGLVAMLEESMHIRWSVITTRNPAFDAKEAVHGAQTFMREHLSDAFSVELDELDDADRAEVLDVIELDTDPAVWRLRRLQQGLSVDESRARVSRTLLAVLTNAVS